MTATVTQLPLAEKFDRFRRRLLPDPETGVERAWTRATTIASTPDDRYTIEKWAQRNIIYGLGQNRDLYALAAASTLDDYKRLTDLAEKAMDRAGANYGRILGEALHDLTDKVDRDTNPEIPAEWESHIDAYCQTLADHHVQLHQEWIEQVVVLPDLGIAGKFDRLVTLTGDTLLTVADLKTGKDVTKYGTTTIAIQLAIYAHATHVWNGSDYDPMPPVNLDKALVIHLPATINPGECSLHSYDIAAGWDAVQLALNVRQWRKTKNLTTPYNILETAPKREPMPSAIADDMTDDDW